MAYTALASAVPGLGQIAIGTNTGLRVQAPEQTVGWRGRSGVYFGGNKLALPAQRAAQVRMIGIQASRFRNHEAPSAAAFKIARVTATRARCTL
jgi:hypothetical protein